MKQQQINEGWQAFVNLSQNFNKTQSLNDFFQFMFTPEELSQLAARTILIRELLKENKTQREIATDFGVSIAKITRGSNELKRIDPLFKEKLKQEFEALNSN